MIRLKPDALAVVREMMLDEDEVLRIKSGQLPPEVYQEVSRALKAIGGKWSKKQDGFLFDRDFMDNFAKLSDQGFFDKKEALDFYATPPLMAQQAVGELQLYAPHSYGAFLAQERLRPFRFLEPSAGHGALADEFKRAYEAAFPGSDNLVIECVELDPVNAQILRDKGYVVHEMDFLQFSTDVKFDVILMNPPFSLKGKKDCYIDHINHALNLVAKDGEVKAIVPSSLLLANSKPKVDLLSRLYRSKGEMVLDGAYADRRSFSDVGANVQTLSLSLTKNAHPDHLPEIDWGMLVCEVANGGTSDLYRELDNKVNAILSRGESITREMFESFLKPLEEQAIKKGVYVPLDQLPMFRREMADYLDLSNLYVEPASSTIKELTKQEIEQQPILAQFVTEPPQPIGEIKVRKIQPKPDFFRM